MKKFGEARRAIEAADLAGMNQKERRALIRQPGPYIEKLLSPRASPPDASYSEKPRADLYNSLEPAMVTAFLRAASGEEANQGTLIRLGNLLHGSIKSVEDRDRRRRIYERRHELVVEYTEGEQRLLRLGVKFIEQALYRGDLAWVYGSEAGTMAFVINRLAKVTQNLPSRGSWDDAEGGDRFNQNRFNVFMDRVSNFAAAYYSPAGLRENIQAAQGRVNELLAAHFGSDHEDVKILGELGRKLASVPLNFDDRAYESANASIQIFCERLQSLEPSLPPQESSARVLMTRIREFLNVSDVQTMMAQSLSGDRTDLLVLRADVQKYLDSFPTEPLTRVQPEGRKGVSLQNFQMGYLANLKNRCQLLLKEWMDVRFFSGPLARSMQEMLVIMRQRDARIEKMRKALPPEVALHVNRACEKESAWRAVARDRRYLYQDFLQSRDGMAGRNRLYFIKTFFVAADMVHTSNEDGLPLEQQMRSLEFVHPSLYDFYAAGQERKDFLRIHYMGGELPFAKMAVLAMQKATQKPSWVQTDSYSLASQDERLARELERGRAECMRAMRAHPEAAVALRGLAKDFFKARDAFDGARKVYQGICDDRGNHDSHAIWAKQKMDNLASVVDQRRQGLVQVFLEYPNIFPPDVWNVDSIDRPSFVRHLKSLL